MCNIIIKSLVCGVFLFGMGAQALAWDDKLLCDSGDAACSGKAWGESCGTNGVCEITDIKQERNDDVLSNPQIVYCDCVAKDNDQNDDEMIPVPMPDAMPDVDSRELSDAEKWLYIFGYRCFLSKNNENGEISSPIIKCARVPQDNRDQSDDSDEIILPIPFIDR